MVDFGSVWVTGSENGELYRIDPKSNAIVSTTRLHDKPRFIASGEGSIWVLNQGDGTVQRIDGRSGEVLATIETIGRLDGGDIVCGGGYVWISVPGTPVAQIDPRTNTLIRRFTGSGLMGDAIRYGAGSLWVWGRPSTAYVAGLKQGWAGMAGMPLWACGGRSASTWIIRW